MTGEIRKMVMEARDRAAESGMEASIEMHHENSHLMRIGNSSVSLNTSEELTRFDIEVISGRRRGTHTILGEVNSAEELFRIMQEVAEKAQCSGEMDYAPVLPVITRTLDQTAQYDPELERLDPSVKEEVYSGIIRSCGGEYDYSGAWSSGSVETFVVTTASGNSCRTLLTDQQFTCVLKHPVKKWELAHWQTGWKAGSVTAGRTVENFSSLLPVYQGHEGFRVEPGRYKVVFGSQALGELAGMAVWTGCHGRAWEMGTAWTSSKKPGDRVFHDSITVLDDPSCENVFSSPMSDSGMPSKTVPMISGGRLSSLMYDRNTASKYGKEPTPNAGCLSMLPGEGPADLSEALKDHEMVLYIPAIHYMNLPNMSRGIFTGSSRFSAVLIRNGRVASPIFSSRITDSFERVFGNVLGMSRETVSVNTSNTYGRRNPSALSVPSWMLVDDVKITDCADSF